MKEGCRLIEETKKLAKKKGLDPRDVYCSEMSSCCGTYCPRINLGDIDDVLPKPSRIEAFNIRQNKAIIVK